MKTQQFAVRGEFIQSLDVVSPGRLKPWYPMTFCVS